MVNFLYKKISWNAKEIFEKNYNNPGDNMDIMDIKVLKYEPKQGDKTRGFVTVQCNGWEMYLRMRQFKNSHLYIEMPVVKYAGYVYRPIQWPSREVSNLFQSEVLRQLKEDLGADLEIKHVEPPKEDVKKSVVKKK